MPKRKNGKIGVLAAAVVTSGSGADDEWAAEVYGIVLLTGRRPVLFWMGAVDMVDQPNPTEKG